jgi:glycosyltransferase involved in cell wall biosynthesis
MNDDRSRFAAEVIDQLPSADLLHLHWISGFVDVPHFFEVIDLPVVWTLHDMNPLTGGCHYNFGCRRFEKKCGLCPRLDSTSEDDPSRRSWRRKRIAFHEKARRDQLHIVSPSIWLKQQAEQSSLFGEFPIYNIPNGVDHTLFRSRNAESERSELGISSAQKVLLFVAHTRSNDRKGFQLLLDALAELDVENVTLLSVGGNEPNLPDQLSHVHAGYVKDDRKLARLYSLADLFVIPSLQDNLPNTVLESMACGTPVVGFNTGGIPDMVRPEETGWLADSGDVRSLRDTLEAALFESDVRERKARRCREVVEEEYTLERQAQRYADLYDSILGG